MNDLNWFQQILVVFLVIVVFREIIGWYFKTGKIVEQLDKIIKLLDKPND